VNRRPSKLLSPLRREAYRGDHIQHQLNSLSFYDSVPLYDTDRCSSPTTAHNGMSRLTAHHSDMSPFDHRRHYRLHSSLYPSASFSHQPADRCSVPYCRHRHRHGRHKVALRHAVSASDADYDNFRRRLIADRRRCSDLVTVKMANQYSVVSSVASTSVAGVHQEKVMLVHGRRVSSSSNSSSSSMEP